MRYGSWPKEGAPIWGEEGGLGSQGLCMVKKHQEHNVNLALHQMAHCLLMTIVKKMPIFKYVFLCSKLTIIKKNKIKQSPILRKLRSTELIYSEPCDNTLPHYL